MQVPGWLYQLLLTFGKRFPQAQMASNPQNPLTFANFKRMMLSKCSYAAG